MGKFEKGILGPFSGAVGPVVGGSWNGISYMRSKPRRRKGKATVSQQQHQAKFTLVIKFLQTMKNLVATGFSDRALSMSGFNRAFSYHLKNAVSGDYPAYSMNYAAVLISQGNLPNVNSPAAQAVSNSSINFTWADNSGTGNASADDQCMVAVYCPELNITVYNMNTALRRAREASIQVSQFTNKEVHTYLSFISAEESNVATSVYLGAVTVL